LFAYLLTGPSIQPHKSNVPTIITPTQNHETMVSYRMALRFSSTLS
jgi:hypothetical protein